MKTSKLFFDSGLINSIFTSSYVRLLLVKVTLIFKDVLYSFQKVGRVQVSLFLFAYPISVTVISYLWHANKVVKRRV